MKKLILITWASIIWTFVQSQTCISSLPTQTYIKPYHLELGLNATTVLVFPATIKDCDRGTGDFLVQKSNLLGNVLKIKAAKKDFVATNLHVFTGDGGMYVFTVAYNEKAVQTTFDLSRLESNRGLVTLNLPLNEVQLDHLMQSVKSETPFFSRTSSHFKMELKLQGIYLASELMLFNVEISNLSNVTFDMDFTRLYIKDKQKAKRYSIQQQEISAVKKDSTEAVCGHCSINYAFVVPKFTVPDGKDFIIEIYEKNGGRHLTMKIKNHHLLKAKSLKVAS